MLRRSAPRSRRCVAKQCRIYRDGARCELSLREQFRLVFANVPRPQAVRRAAESSRKIFHYPDVTAYGSLSVIATLEFFQHNFSEMGHRDLLVTQTYPNREATTAPVASRVASVARAASSKSASGKLRVDDVAVTEHLSLPKTSFVRILAHEELPR